MLGFLLLIAVAAIRLRDLFAVVMLFGIYSLLTAVLFMDLDAVDVAFTEAAVPPNIGSGGSSGACTGSDETASATSTPLNNEDIGRPF